MELPKNYPYCSVFALENIYFCCKNIWQCPPEVRHYPGSELRGIAHGRGSWGLDIEAAPLPPDSQGPAIRSQQFLRPLCVLTVNFKSVSDSFSLMFSTFPSLGFLFTVCENWICQNSKTGLQYPLKSWSLHSPSDELGQLCRLRYDCPWEEERFSEFIKVFGDLGFSPPDQLF